jgi:hypothetical protein
MQMLMMGFVLISALHQENASPTNTTLNDILFQLLNRRHDRLHFHRVGQPRATLAIEDSACAA